MARQTLTSGQVARMLNIPARTIRSYLTTGRLQAEQNPVTGRWSIGRESLTRFMREHGLDPARLNRPLRVLVIDRDQASGPLVRRALTGAGRPAMVEVEADCASALISLGSAPPDVVMLDADTAGERCLELVDALRSHERTRNVRLLLLSAQQAEQRSELRAHGWVAKPLIEDRLAGSFERLLARAQ